MENNLNESVVKLIELHQIKKKLEGNYIIHISGDDWKKAIHNVPVIEYDKNLHPDISGPLVVPVDPYNLNLGVIVIPATCPNGCKKQIGLDNFGRCDCPPGIDLPHLGSGGIPKPQRINCYPIRSANGLISCTGPGCHNCKPERRVIRLGKLILAEWIVCVCNNMVDQVEH